MTRIVEFENQLGDLCSEFSDDVPVKEMKDILISKAENLYQERKDFENFMKNEEEK